MDILLWCWNEIDNGFKLGIFVFYLRYFGMQCDQNSTCAKHNDESA
jgi:hypothetical protein